MLFRFNYGTSAVKFYISIVSYSTSVLSIENYDYKTLSSY